MSSGAAASLAIHQVEDRPSGSGGTLSSGAAAFRQGIPDPGRRPEDTKEPNEDREKEDKGSGRETNLRTRGASQSGGTTTSGAAAENSTPIGFARWMQDELNDKQTTKQNEEDCHIESGYSHL